VSVGQAMRVVDYMTRNVITLTPELTCERAKAIMRAAGICRLPVVDRLRLIGIVTDGDLERRVPRITGPSVSAADQEALLRHVRVCGVMTYGPITGGPSMALGDAVALMRRCRINTLPVVEGQRLVGILTMGDAVGVGCGSPALA
jgi:acetoin utilization protein AcuB